MGVLRMNRPLYNIDRWVLFATHKYRYLFKNVWGVFSRYLKDLFRCSKGDFLGYQEYKNKVAFLDYFYFQQNTRKQSIRNLKPVFYLSKGGF